MELGKTQGLFSEPELLNQSLLTIEDLATRWQCSVSRLRNVPDRDLPAKTRLPGSRLVRFRLIDVIQFEASHVVRVD